MESEHQTTYRIYKERQEPSKELPVPTRNEVEVIEDEYTLFATVRELNKELGDEETLNRMDPTTREDYVASLELRRKRLVAKMRMLETREALKNLAPPS